MKASGDLAALLQKHAAYLPAFFIVSQVVVENVATNGGSTSSGIEGLKIHGERAHGGKCARCWNYSTHVGENADYPTVCERCVAALDGNRKRWQWRRSGGKRETLMPGDARQNWYPLAFLALGVLAADQLSKYAVEKFSRGRFIPCADSWTPESRSHQQSGSRLRPAR